MAKTVIEFENIEEYKKLLEDAKKQIEQLQESLDRITSFTIRVF